MSAEYITTEVLGQGEIQRRRDFGGFEEGIFTNEIFDGRKYSPTPLSIRKVRNNFMATAISTFLSSISPTSGESRFSSTVKPSLSAKNHHGGQGLD